MTPAILNLLPASSEAHSSPAATAAKPAGDPGDLFRVALSGLLGSGVSTKSASAPTSATSATSATDATALAAKIKKMLDAGATASDVAASLAASLAAAVAAKLGITGADARSKLEAAFNSALAPPGSGGGGDGASTSSTAQMLAAQYVAIENAADAAAGQTNGQQNRLTGNVLDAQSAKGTPAQTNPIDGAATPPVQFASSTATSTATATATAAVTATAKAAVTATAAGDGRSVTLAGRTPLSSGGDTLLGRILGRADLVDAQRQTVAPASTGTTAAGTDGESSTSTSTSTSSQSATLSAFLKNFSTALEREAASATGTVPDAHVLAPAADSGTASAPAAFVPPVAPFTIDRSPAATGPASAGAPAAPAPVDPSDIADQLVRGAFVHTTAGTSEVRLSLVPESLGDVSVKLVVGASGSVSAHVTADSSEARDVLVAAQPQLNKSLAEAGLKLSSFTVDLSNNGFGSSAGQANDRQDPKRRLFANGSIGAVDSIDDEAGLDAIPAFGPSIAGPSGDYNYLA